MNYAAVAWAVSSCVGVVAALLLLRDMSQEQEALRAHDMDDGLVKRALVHAERTSILLHLLIVVVFLALGIYALLHLDFGPDLVAWGLVLGNIILVVTLLLQYRARKYILRLPVPDGPGVIIGKQLARAEMKFDADKRTQAENHLDEGGLIASKTVPRDEAEQDATKRTTEEGR